VAQKLAAKNLQRLSSQHFDLIVTDCSSCASFLKKYPQLFSENDEKRKTAQIISECVQDMVQLTASQAEPAISQDTPITVTYHDPCHASRGQGLSNEPREILKSLPGIEYREMPEADWCCGGAGSYAWSHYDLSRKVLDRKIENLKGTRADVLATSCPACIIHLSYGVRKHGLNTTVCHISQVVNGDHLTEE
jgi:glycolate oxidase iron-sulfur subunit